MLDLDALFIIIYLGIWIYGFAVLIYYFFNKEKISKEMLKRKRLDDDSFRTSNSHNHTNQNSSNGPDLINPTTGALMIGGFAGVDTFGNSFGSDVSGGFDEN